MKIIKFERELKVLINYIREYGIQHIEGISNPSDILDDESKWSEFAQAVHKGFYLAQNRSIKLIKQVLTERKQQIQKLKEARRGREKEKCNEITNVLNQLKYQEMCLRKIMDSIAWQILGYDLSQLRRLYYGQELIDITDSNLESELSFVDEYLKDNPDSFVLISDLTSFIQIGDVVIFKPREKVILVELKEGDTNGKVFRLLDEFITANCKYPAYQKLMNETPKFQEQFQRDIKQIQRNSQVVQTLNTGKGKDLLSNMDVVINSSETIVLDTYTDIIKSLLDESDRKGHAISVVEECLLIGVYNTEKFPSKVFDIWAKCLNIKMPIIDFRQSLFDPLGYPIFLHSLPQSQILDIILGKKIVKFTIDIEMWLQTFRNHGITYRWMSKKETARINGKFKGNQGIFSLEGCGIELENNEGIKQILGEGVFSRMFTSLNTPSSLIKYLKKSFISF